MSSIIENNILTGKSTIDPNAMLLDSLEKRPKDVFDQLSEQIGGITQATASDVLYSTLKKINSEHAKAWYIALYEIKKHQLGNTVLTGAAKDTLIPFDHVKQNLGDAFEVSGVRRKKIMSVPGIVNKGYSLRNGKKDIFKHVLQTPKLEYSQRLDECRAANKDIPAKLHTIFSSTSLAYRKEQSARQNAKRFYDVVLPGSTTNYADFRPMLDFARFVRDGKSGVPNNEHDMVMSDTKGYYYGAGTSFKWYGSISQVTGKVYVSPKTEVTNIKISLVNADLVEDVDSADICIVGDYVTHVTSEKHWIGKVNMFTDTGLRDAYLKSNNKMWYTHLNERHNGEILCSNRSVAGWIQILGAKIDDIRDAYIYSAVYISYIKTWVRLNGYAQSEVIEKISDEYFKGIEITKYRAEIEKWAIVTKEETKEEVDSELIEKVVSLDVSMEDYKDMTEEAIQGLLAEETIDQDTADKALQFIKSKKQKTDP